MRRRIKSILPADSARITNSYRWQCRHVQIVRLGAPRLPHRMLRRGPVATIGASQGTGQNRQIRWDR